MSKVISFPKKARKSGGGGTGGNRPPDAEIVRVLGEVTKTLQDASYAIQKLEADIAYLEAANARHAKYLLTIVQALLRAGVEIPLTSKKPEDS